MFGRATTLATMLCLTGSRLVAVGADLADLIEKAEKSVVRVNINGGAMIGSGFLVAPNVIVTNAHVVNGAIDGAVEFSDGQRAPIQGFLEVSPRSDVAILQIDAPDRTPLALTKADVRKGETVLAIGAPKGLSFSSSDGIVSGVRSTKEVSKSMGESIPYDDDVVWIQTTAAISKGNSGGPLMNMSGEVVGMNTLSLAPIGGQNINFAVSWKDIQKVLDRGRRDVQPFGNLPRGMHPDPNRRPPGSGEPMPGELAIKLPSGRTVDEQAVFLQAYRYRTVTVPSDNLATVKFPNGKPQALLVHRRGKLDGPAVALYESGESATVASYSGGQRHGVLLTWAENGDRVVFAQYENGRESGLLCYYKDNRLVLVRETFKGRVDAVHLIKDREITKSLQVKGIKGDALAKVLDAAERETKELEGVLLKMKEAEVKIRRAAAESFKSQQRGIAAENSLAARASTIRRGAAQAAENNAAIQSLVRRALALR